VADLHHEKEKGATLLRLQLSYFSVKNIIARTNLSVRPSHAGIVPRRIKIALRGLHCEVAEAL